MGFPGFPLPDELPSFCDHQDVLKYLQDYADHYEIRKYFKVSSTIEIFLLMPSNFGQELYIYNHFESQFETVRMIKSQLFGPFRQSSDKYIIDNS
jgi:hypothetical protein